MSWPPTRFERIEADKIVRLTVYDPGCGVKGIRDSDYPCEAFDPFEPGYKPNGDCDTDGHYLCIECRNLNPRSEYAHEDCQCARWNWVGPCNECDGSGRVSRLYR